MTELAEAYPTLHVVVAGERVTLKGSYPVCDGAEVLDWYSVEVTLATNHPAALPTVREVGGRIPWLLDRHVRCDGSACVVLPDAARNLRWSTGPPRRMYLCDDVAFARARRGDGDERAALTSEELHATLTATDAAFTPVPLASPTTLVRTSRGPVELATAGDCPVVVSVYGAMAAGISRCSSLAPSPRAGTGSSRSRHDRPGGAVPPREPARRADPRRRAPRNRDAGEHVAIFTHRDVVRRRVCAFLRAHP